EPVLRDFILDAGAGSLTVDQDGSLSFQDFSLATDGNLHLKSLDIDASGQSLLASRQGALHNEAGELFQDAQSIRLYAREEGDLGDLAVDRVIEDVNFPDNPD